VYHPHEVLPAHLAERVASRSAAALPADGAYILYWMRTAVRAHENPALDTALRLASTLGLPVFVYHAVTERYPYASDRHHLFMLEGARGCARALRARGIGTAFHLERAGHRGPHLRTLAASAAVVVTELMPVAPLRDWTAALAATSPAPVWEVDTACIVPVTLTTRAFERAFAYRDATAVLRRNRVHRVWSDEPVPTPPYVPPLPFAPIDLETADVPALIAACQIDHAVGPVADTRGGSEAGYARWSDFVTSGRLDRYHVHRNDPARPDAVSRMSAYLHYGMVSPLRLAREAAARSSEGAAKWLDELLVWRELAYTFCHHRPDHETLAAIPDWARETLRQHERDHREVLSWETLARGRTPDEFWNTMQHSLLAHGELHNNVRMTWGKAFPGWTDTSADALAHSIDLNHRYALDGRDPASYGGLLWCLGQFDRPFTPPTRVLGTVRARPSGGQAARIDVARYTAHIARARHEPRLRVAVIGAGLAGLACARTLHDHQVDVTVVERARGVGGRTATRRDGLWHFDHGAQYFTTRDPRLERWIASWEQDGVVAEWRGTFAVHDEAGWHPTRTAVRRLVGTPSMSAIASHLASDLTVRLETPVAGLVRDGEDWRLTAADGAPLATADVVLVCVPAPQASALLREHVPAMAVAIQHVNMQPTAATMLVLAARPDVAWDGAFINDNPVLSWVARNASKPGRGDHETWVLHGTPGWSQRHLSADPSAVAREMSDAFRQLIDTPIDVVHASGHRWSYAIPDPALTDEALYDPMAGLGAGGDWCGGPRVEGALMSGIALAGRVLTAAHCR
jgi:photolyase PhrII